MPDINPLKNRFVVLLADNRLNAQLLESQLDQQQQLVYTGHQNNAFTLLQTLTFHLILLAFDKNALELIHHIKNTDSLNRKAPVFALMNEDQAHQKKKLLDAGYEDCLIGPSLEKQVIEIIHYWRVKNSTATALNYIQLIQNKTKYNHRLTLTIFNKLFEELPLQIKIIEDALSRQHYKLAEETVHKLHGSASFCDLEELRELAHTLEICLINENYEAIDRHFLMLQVCTLDFISHQPSILANLLRN